MALEDGGDDQNDQAAPQQQQQPDAANPAFQQAQMHATFADAMPPQEYQSYMQNARGSTPSEKYAHAFTQVPDEQKWPFMQAGGKIATQALAGARQAADKGDWGNTATLLNAGMSHILDGTDVHATPTDQKMVFNIGHRGDNHTIAVDYDRLGSWIDQPENNNYHQIMQNPGNLIESLHHAQQAPQAYEKSAEQPDGEIDEQKPAFQQKLAAAKAGPPEQQEDESDDAITTGTGMAKPAPSVEENAMAAGTGEKPEDHPDTTPPVREARNMLGGTANDSTAKTANDSTAKTANDSTAKLNQMTEATGRRSTLQRREDETHRHNMATEHQNWMNAEQKRQQDSFPDSYKQQHGAKQDYGIPAGMGHEAYEVARDFKKEHGREPTDNELHKRGFIRSGDNETGPMVPNMSGKKPKDVPIIEDEYNDLKSGEKYLAPDGKYHIKP